MSRISFEDFLPPLPGLNNDLDFNPVKLLKDASHFHPPGLPRLEPPSLHFSDPFEKLSSVVKLPHDKGLRLPDYPMPHELLGINFSGDRDVVRTALKLPLPGEVEGHLSNLISRPGSLMKFNLHAGTEEIGGILSHITSPVKHFFSRIGDVTGLSGIAGSISSILPIGGIIGGLFGGHKEGIKGLVSSVASGFAFGGPIGAGIMGLANITGLDKLAGKALGGIAKGIGEGFKAIGKGIKGLFGF